MIQSALNSVKQFVPNLIRKFESLIKGKEIKEAGSGKSIKLTDSKIITKERKTIKDSLFNFIDSAKAELDNDIHSVKSNHENIVISTDEFENFISEFKNEIMVTFEAFITEKKMGPTLAKYSTIVLSGLLIKKLNKDK